MTTVFESDWENSRLLEENERLRAQNTKMYDEIERLRILSKQQHEALVAWETLDLDEQQCDLAIRAFEEFNK